MQRNLITLFWISLGITTSVAREPDCPFGSPKVELADVDGRCDRFWICEDGLISDAFCPNGQGFNVEVKQCDREAPCLKDGSSSGINRTPGLKRIADILVKKPVLGLVSPDQASEFKQAVSRMVTPLVTPILRAFILP